MISKRNTSSSPHIIDSWSKGWILHAIGTVILMLLAQSETALRQRSILSEPLIGSRITHSISVVSISPRSLPTQEATPSILFLMRHASPGPRGTRVKRGYHGHGRGYSTGIAYNRIGDAGHRRYGGKGKRRQAVGEDGTHIQDFKSYGVGYEHVHSGHCEESKCGYNIRHCPHGCVFNSFTCGGGASYDICCC